MAITFSNSALVFLASVGCILYICYRSLTFKPIPGIPYHQTSAYTILGDLPRLLAQLCTGETLFPWLMNESARQNSAIVQVFIRFFQQPWVIIADHRESQDILLRRTKEFDRSTFQADVLGGITPKSHALFSSDHKDFKRHKNLLKGLMAPAFLDQVAAPHIHAAIDNLIECWLLKSSAAEEHPFAVSEDVYNAILDAITALAFGLDVDGAAVMSQIRHLQASATPKVPSDANTPVTFESAIRPQSYQALVDLSDSVEWAVKSPFPRLTHWCVRQLPWYRRADRAKETLILGELDKGIARIRNGDNTEKCALDNVLQRENTTAQKEIRKPDFKSRMIVDELFGFLNAGHDTTATTILWGLKYLSSSSTAQSTLRGHLRRAYPLALACQRLPTVDEITKTSVPYLDATIEEINRIACIAPAVLRTAKLDTTILGHPIPKGTTVLLAQTGPDYFAPGFDIPEERRSASFRAAKYQIGSWNVGDMHVFDPARWLKHDSSEGEKEVYDATAGPHLAFGLGPRACYGKRLAYLQLRITLVLIVWSFELLEIHGELGGFRGIEKLNKVPANAYLRLRKVEG